MGARARKYMETNFDKKDIIHMYMKTYSELGFELCYE